MICVMGQIVLCRGAQWPGAWGGKWYPPGTHSKTVLRLVVCPPPSQTPEKCVRNLPLRQLVPRGHWICLALVARTGLCCQILEAPASQPCQSPHT